jgi:hypothetical protein
MALNQNAAMDPNAMATDPMMANQTGPASPASPAAPSGQDLATPDQVNSLWDLLNQIETKYREMNAEKFASGNQVESQKRDLVVEVFKALQGAGIDITNVEEVRKFLDELEQSNPDLYQMFVDAFNSLLGGAEGSAPAAGQGQNPLAPEVPGTPGSMAPPAPGGALGPMPGGSANPTPSGPGLAGMVPPEAGANPTQRFPNLVK